MSPIRHLAKTLAVAAAIGLVLTACGTESGSDTGVDPGAPGAVDLDGDWTLTAATLDGADLDLSPGPITLSVDGAKWSGTSACNQYFADVTRDGDQVTLGAVGGTEMACDEPRMTLEGHYWSALQAVTSASRDGDSLVLTGDGVTLTFGTVVPPEPANLIDTTWTLTTLLEGETASSVIARPATLQLHEDGRVTGSTGCRRFVGQWTTEGEDLVIGPLGTTRNACRGAAELQDRHVLQVLDGPVRATVDGTTLTVQKGSLGLGFSTDQG